MNLTAANQLTLTRMMLIPGFVILLMYGYRGWAPPKGSGPAKRFGKNR